MKREYKLSYLHNGHKVEITLYGQSGFACFVEFIKGLSGKVDSFSFSIQKENGLPMAHRQKGGEAA